MAAVRTVTYEGREVSVPIPDHSYLPFNPELREFRLLTLDLDVPNDATITGSLKHYDLDEYPEYTALSYEWGDPSQVSWIIVDSSAFPVADNLLQALQSLSAQKCPLIWVDAICIDQNNETEKANHIPYMTEIYHQAEAVCAWVGPERDGSDKVLDMLRAMDISRRSLQAKAPWKPDKEVVNRYEHQLQAFLGRSYWQRVWIVQEISVASRIYILCGSRIVQWAGLELMMSWLQELVKPNENEKVQGIKSWFVDRELPTTNELNGKANFSIKSPAFTHMARLLRSRSDRFEGRPVGLLENLFQTAGSKASDSRDKVFGLLGLSFDGANFVKQPSYKRTEDELALEMTAASIWSKKSLDIIFLAGSTAARYDDSWTPSWCPNYHHLVAAASSDHICTYLTGHADQHRVGVRGIRWRATGDSVMSKGRVSIEDDLSLVTQGTRIGWIASVGTSLDGTMPVTPRNKLTEGEEHVENSVVAAAINQAMAFYSWDYTTQTSSPSVLRYVWEFDGSTYNQSIAPGLGDRFRRVSQWRKANGKMIIRNSTLHEMATTSICAGRYGTMFMDNDRITRAAIGIGAASVVMATKFLVANPSIRKGIDSAKQRQLNPDKDRAVNPNLVDALEGFQDLIAEGLRFVSTTHNFHIGWAHRNVLPGDEVFLLLGCSMPAVLRPCHSREGYYTVVGHAYLNDVMDGVYWNRLSKSDMEEVKIF